LRHDTRGLNHLAVLAGTAIPNGRLIGVDFNNRIVNFVAAKSGENVLYRLNFGVALSQRGGAGCLRDMLDASLNLGLAIQVDTAKANARVGGSREKANAHPVAAVKADSGKANGLTQSLLL
jgi:hypothetical protein